MRIPDIELHIKELANDNVERVEIWVLESGSDVPAGAQELPESFGGHRIAYRQRKGENDDS